MPQDPYRISGKDLGYLALPDHCPRCFWVKRHTPAGLPFQIFPGIFSSIDAYTKKFIHGYLDQHGRLPPWLDGLGDVIGYKEPPHHSKFQIVDQETGILLTGAPDGILVRSTGEHIIVDYKTAKYTKGQDALAPIYATQINAYALIAEERGFSPVDALALLYGEPVTDDEGARLPENVRPDGFSMGFIVSVHPVTLDTSMVRPLLRRAKEILDLPQPPERRAGCKDCARLDGLFELVAPV